MKRSGSPMPENQPEKRSKHSIQKIRLQLDDLWKHVPVFPVGPEWSKPPTPSQFNWKFSNLEAAFKKDGPLHGKEKVYLFCCADEPFSYSLDDPKKKCWIPTIVAIVSSVPPSQELSIHKGSEQKIIGMNKMRMGWVPCILLGEGGSSLEQQLPEIFIIGNVKREVTEDYFEIDSSSQCCSPYFKNPYKVIDETKRSSVVDIVFEDGETVITTRFNWMFHTVKGFASRLVSDGTLSDNNKDAFKALVRSAVEAKKIANHEAAEKERRDMEESRRTDTRAAAFARMKFYKFYPVDTPDTPDLSAAKTPHINMYYGKADEVL